MTSNLKPTYCALPRSERLLDMYETCNSVELKPSRCPDALKASRILESIYTTNEIRIKQRSSVMHHAKSLLVAGTAE